MPANRKVGVSDVAKHAGVAIGTVSNYLNYPERVSDTLKVKISKAIAELGYVPRRSATAGTAATADPSNPRIIGYVMTEIEHSLFTSIFEGIQEVCEDNNMQVIGLNASSDLERQHELVRTLISLHVTGILLSTVLDPSQDVTAARSAGIPIILIDHSNAPGHEPVCAILENNVSAGQLAADELIRLGCRHIAFAAHSFDYESIQDRQLGVERAVARTGGKVSYQLINSGGILLEDGRNLGAKLSNQAERLHGIHDSESDTDHSAGEPTSLPDGIVTGSDQLAIGMLMSLTERGVLRVPDDLSIIGTEGVCTSAISPMSLTTVQAPGVDMGRKAMMQMLDYIENPVSHVHGTTLIEPTLVRRASTRPVLE